MTTVLSTLKARSQREVRALRKDPDLPKLSLRDKAQNLLYSVLGFKAGYFIAFAFIFMITQGIYQVGGHSYSLATWYANFGDSAFVVHGLAWLHIGGPSGAGGWVASYWPLIRERIPVIIAGLVGYFGIAMLLGFGNARALDDPDWMDRLLCKLGFANPHMGQIDPKTGKMLGKHQRTSFLQYVVSFFAMIPAGLVGIVGGCIVIYGGAALFHKLGINPWNPVDNLHWGWARVLLAGAAWQGAVIGVLGGHFYARKVTLKPGKDMQDYFLDRRLATIALTNRWFDAYDKGELKRDDFRGKLSKLGSTYPSLIYPPIERILFWQRMEANKPVPPHSGWARWFMPLLAAVGPLLLIAGWYWAVYFPAHGGWRI